MRPFVIKFSFVWTDKVQKTKWSLCVSKYDGIYIVSDKQNPYYYGALTLSRQLSLERFGERNEEGLFESLS